MEKISGFSLVNEDVIQNILSRLPALSFGSAACVSKCWNKLCRQILSRPRFASALSLNPSLHDAVKEVTDKVLSKPIRPHFAIACICNQHSLEVTHRLITEKLGSRVPVVTNAASGIIGMDAHTNKPREVIWELVDEDDLISQGHDILDRGIVLVVGFVPGLRVGTVPLLRPKQAPQLTLVDRFVIDIGNYTASVSDCTSPAGIILFGDQNIDMKPILAKMDGAMPEETAIVGDASGSFLCQVGDNSQNSHADMYFFGAVALVFARDRAKSHDIGETQFHVTSSTGVIPFGPQLKAVCVVAKDSDCSWLTARMEGQDQILHGQGVLHDINEQFDDQEPPDLYIGVMRQRECPNGSESLGCGTSLAFYEVLRGDNDFFVINGVGIKPGDSFLFYHSDSDTASSSCCNAYKDLAMLGAELKIINCLPLSGVSGHGYRKEVFGGFIFSCHFPGKSFFKHPNMDCFPFCENFPGVPLAGVFCSRAIGRGSRISMHEEISARCCLHVCSTVYLVMSYVPAPSECSSC